LNRQLVRNLNIQQPAHEIENIQMHPVQKTEQTEHQNVTILNLPMLCAQCDVHANQEDHVKSPFLLLEDQSHRHKINRLKMKKIKKKRKEDKTE
jgi:hypothetical protein